MLLHEATSQNNIPQPLLSQFPTGLVSFACWRGHKLTPDKPFTTARERGVDESSAENNGLSQPRKEKEQKEKVQRLGLAPLLLRMVSTIGHPRTVHNCIPIMVVVVVIVVVAGTSD